MWARIEVQVLTWQFFPAERHAVFQVAGIPLKNAVFNPLNSPTTRLEVEKVLTTLTAPTTML
jgi:hypothetical protein